MHLRGGFANYFQGMNWPGIRQLRPQYERQSKRHDTTIDFFFAANETKDNAKAVLASSDG